MKISYDKKADAVYIEFGKGHFAANKKIDDFTIADVDKNGNIIGIEILQASKRIPAKNLSGMSIGNRAVAG